MTPQILSPDKIIEYVPVGDITKDKPNVSQIRITRRLTEMVHFLKLKSSLKSDPQTDLSRSPKVKGLPSYGCLINS